MLPVYIDEAVAKMSHNKAFSYTIILWKCGFSTQAAMTQSMNFVGSTCYYENLILELFDKFTKKSKYGYRMNLFQLRGIE